MVADSAALSVTSMIADPRYGALTVPERNHIDARLAYCQRVDAALRRRAAILAEAQRSHNGRKLSEGALRKIYYEQWIRTDRDWFELRDKNLRPNIAPDKLSDAFVDHWHQRVTDFRGKARAAHRSIKREWDRGIIPPGFEGTPWTPDMPAGTSYTNLMKSIEYRPTKLMVKVARNGVRSADAFLPSVFTTRVGLAFGSRFVFDDMWHDHKVLVPGQTGLRRLLEFHCVEMLSGCQVARGMKPEILNDRSGKFERLKEKELLFLLAHVLGNLGYNSECCWLMMEHGTASISERVSKILHDASGGALEVKRGTIGDGALAPGLYGGASRGNFKFKAGLESLGNLVHNEMSDRRLMPAQTGSNSRTDAVDDLHGRDKSSAALIAAAATLPPELREMLRMPATPLWQGIEIADRIQEEMNRRHDHELEGWDALGFRSALYRLHPDQPWQPQTQIAEMPPALRAPLESALETDHRLTKSERMSPRQVFDARRSQLTKLPAHVIPMLVGMDHAVERKIGHDGEFHFSDMEVGPGDHHYEGLCYATDGAPCRLPAGSKFATFVSMIDRQKMHLCDAKGAYVGWVNRRLVPTHGEAHGMARAYGQTMKTTNELLGPSIRAGRAQMRRDAEQAEHNAAVMKTAHAGDFVPPAEPETGPQKRSRKTTTQKQNRSAADRARRLRQKRETATL